MTTFSQSSVWITGASTGIGAAAVAQMHRYGWWVFAGVRRQADADALLERYPRRVQPVLMDVTDDASVAKAAEQVSAAVGEHGLQGLVNNAGVSIVGPLEALPLDQVRLGLAVNVTGVVAVTQAALPLLRAGQGRIVNVGSPSGRFAAPYFGVYAASKFGLRALSDSLRVELRRWHIRVSLVEPGAVATPIWDKGAADVESLVDALPEDQRDRYERQLKRVAAYTRKMSKTALPVAQVAAQIAHALTSAQPRAYYPLGRDARFMRWLTWLPAGLRDRLARRMFG